MEEPVIFSANDISLEGMLSIPSRSPRIGVVVCHPHPLHGGDMHNSVVSALVSGFQGAGMATLRFNFRGVGASGGMHDEGRAELDDVKAAVTHLASRRSFAEIVVAGYSFGAMVGLRAGADDPRVRKLIGVALPIAARDPSFLDAVSKPKLLISGDRDDYSPVPDLRHLVAKLPAPGTLIVIAGADHFFAGHEKQVTAAAVAFLNEPGS